MASVNRLKHSKSHWSALGLAALLALSGCGGGSIPTSADTGSKPVSYEKIEDPYAHLDAEYRAVALPDDAADTDVWWSIGADLVNALDDSVSSAGRRSAWHETNPEKLNKRPELPMGRQLNSGSSGHVRALATRDLSKPNILLVVLDDFGWGYLKDNYAAARTAAGNALVLGEELDYRDKTKEKPEQVVTADMHETMVANAAEAMPFVNQMVSKGLRLENMYVTNSLCGPSRAAIITGRHSARLGFNTNDSVVRSGLPAPGTDGITYMPALLKAQGYRTAAIGKYHAKVAKWDTERVDDPVTVGYDYFYGFNSHGTSYYQSDAVVQWSKRRGTYVKARQREGVYLTDAFTDAATDWLNRVNDQSPVFLHVAYNAIHGPLGKDAPAAYRIYNTGNADADRTLSYMHAVDEGLTQIWNKLTEKGMADNTIVLFVADNGSPGGDKYFAPANSPMRGGKGQQYQGSLKVPAFAYSPNWISGGRTTASIRSSTDYAATVLDMAGVDPSEIAKLDGKSMRKLFNADTVDDVDADVAHPYIYAMGHNAGNWGFAFQPDRDDVKAPGSWMVRSQDHILYFSAKEEYLNYAGKPTPEGTTGTVFGLYAWNDWNQTTKLGGTEAEAKIKADMSTALKDWINTLPTPKEGCYQYWADVCGSVGRVATDVCTQEQVNNAAKPVAIGTRGPNRPRLLVPAKL